MVRVPSVTGCQWQLLGQKSTTSSLSTPKQPIRLDIVEQSRFSELNRAIHLLRQFQSRLETQPCRLILVPKQHLHFER